jgi:hypothetical protein
VGTSNPRKHRRCPRSPVGSPRVADAHGRVVSVNYWQKVTHCLYYFPYVMFYLRFVAKSSLRKLLLRMGALYPISYHHRYAVSSIVLARRMLSRENAVSSYATVSRFKITFLSKKEKNKKSDTGSHDSKIMNHIHIIPPVCSSPTER